MEAKAQQLLLANFLVSTIHLGNKTQHTAAEPDICMFVSFFQGLGLNCFRSGDGFGIIDCPYFPLGDPKVCYVKTGMKSAEKTWVLT